MNSFYEGNGGGCTERRGERVRGGVVGLGGGGGGQRERD